MQRWIATALLSASLIVPAFAQAPAKKAPQASAAPVDPRLKSPPAKLELKEGDTIVFLGDSITHQCLYTQYVTDYFYTRFPGLHLRFHNSGVGGDRAIDCLERFDMDVAAYKPKYVTILLGMNDGSYRQWDEKIFQAYEKGMLELLDKIKGIGATAIVMGPTMYDRGAMLLNPRSRKEYDSDRGKYYNAVLGYYGTFMRDVCQERGLTYVDMFGPLNDLTAQQRIADPNFTMIPGAVHPNPNGHTVMAVAMLTAMNTPHAVSATIARMTPKGWKVTVSPLGGSISDVTGDADHLSFTDKARCIPWELPPEAALGYKISIAGHHHSQETLQVQGLAPGKYELKIDGQTIGTYPSAALAFHVELENNEKTPEYQQALAVANLNKEKNDKVVRPMRNLYSQLKGFRHNGKTTSETLAAYIEKMKPKVEDLDKQQADYDQKIYALAQPKPHKYELIKVPAK